MKYKASKKELEIIAYALSVAQDNERDKGVEGASLEVMSKVDDLAHLIQEEVKHGDMSAFIQLDIGYAEASILSMYLWSIEDSLETSGLNDHEEEWNGLIWAFDDFSKSVIPRKDGRV